MIEITNLSKSFPNQKGVKDLNLQVAKGEIMGLLGPNGAGKTTSMRLITGYLYPEKGSVKIDGLDLRARPRQVRSQIGYLPETPPVYPEMTVGAYLQFVAKLKGVTKDKLKEEVNRVAELTGITNVTKQLIGSLSKGYRQRVGLAQALLKAPPVLILDEPTVGLDPKQIIEIRNLIKSLAQEHTVILSSHILPEVTMLCGRVAIIDHGRLLAVDTPERLALRYKKGQRIEIEAKGDREEVAKLLEEVREVTYELIDENLSAWGKTTKFALHKETQEDFREEVFTVFAKSSVPLVELKTISLSLEEIFLKLTTHENSSEVELETGKEADQVLATSQLGAELERKGEPNV